jgi:hypothetical protein
VVLEPAGVLDAELDAAAVLDAGVLDAAGLGEVDVLGAAGALGGAAALDDAGTLEGAGEPAPAPGLVNAEVAEVTVGRAWPTSEEGAAVLADAAPGSTLGPLAADADFAVRSDSPMNTPSAATAIPAAHRQGRRTLVTRPGNPLVTSVTIASRSRFKQE